MWTGREEEVNPLPTGALRSELTVYHVNPHEKLNGMGISKATKRPNCPWREMTDVLFYLFRYTSTFGKLKQIFQLLTQLN